MKRMIDWLIARAPSEADAAPDFPIVHEGPGTPAPESIDELPEPVIQDGKCVLEPVFTIIDYCDSKGNKTRRRITLLNLAHGTNAPILKAVCHERGATRAFRCDRIECFIEPDGEVIEPTDFFRDTLFIDLDQFAPTEHDRALVRARAFREFIRPALSILVTAANADDEFHPEELDAILCYVENENIELTTEGRYDEEMSLRDLDQLTPLIRKMRPSREAVAGYMVRILEYDEDRFERFTDALQKVIEADGELRLSEQMFLDELAFLREKIERKALARLEGCDG